MPPGPVIVVIVVVLYPRTNKITILTDFGSFICAREVGSLLTPFSLHNDLAGGLAGLLAYLPACSLMC